MEASRPSLRDIAKKLGISHATVSLALNNHPKISAATRALVRETARQMGYRPDPMLSALAQYRQGKKAVTYQGTLAWIDNYPTPTAMESYPGFVLYRKGAEARSAELGYKLERFYPHYERISPAKLRDILIARSIRGILIAPQPVPIDSWDMNFEGFSAVTFGYTLVRPRLHVVTSGQFGAGVLAFGKLRERGYRRIGLVIKKEFNERTARNFLGGYLSQHTAFYPGEAASILIHQNELTLAEWKRWRETSHPDAIITDSFHTAEQLRSWNIRIPEELGVALFCTSPDPFWTRIDQNDELVGRVAVTTLVGLLHCNETGVPSTRNALLVEPGWKEGRSLKPPPVIP